MKSMPRAARPIAVLLLVVTLCACGQKGALYHPDQQQKTDDKDQKKDGAGPADGR